MRNLIPAFALVASIAAVPAWAAEPAQGPSSEDTYATMFAYSQTSPHAQKASATVEQTADMKADAAERAQVAQWTAVMGRGDIPEEYLGKGHK